MVGGTARARASWSDRSARLTPPTHQLIGSCPRPRYRNDTATAARPSSLGLCLHAPTVQARPSCCRSCDDATHRLHRPAAIPSHPRGGASACGISPPPPRRGPRPAAADPDPGGTRRPGRRPGLSAARRRSHLLNDSDFARLRCRRPTSPTSTGSPPSSSVTGPATSTPSHRRRRRAVAGWPYTAGAPVDSSPSVRRSRRRSRHRLRRHRQRKHADRGRLPGHLPKRRHQWFTRAEPGDRPDAASPSRRR